MDALSTRKFVDVMFKHMRDNNGKFILFTSKHVVGYQPVRLDGIVLQRISTIKMVQSIGRILRLDDGKIEVSNPISLQKYLKKTESPVMRMMESVYTGVTPIRRS